jgi:hypothetical protein
VNTDANLYLKTDSNVNKIFLPDRYFNMTSDADLLRETQISQFYRYAKKTQLSLDLKKYRYVEEIKTL